MEELIMKHSNEGDLVIDTFAGAATTLVAAHNTSRKWAGCEPDDDYFIKATARLNDLK